MTKVVPAVSEELKDAFVKNIRRRMTPQPMKIRADIELKCFQFDGVLHIKVILILFLFCFLLFYIDEFSFSTFGFLLLAFLQKLCLMAAYNNIMNLQEAMKKAEAEGSDDCPVKIKLVAPPLYVLTTQTLDKVCLCVSHV